MRNAEPDSTPELSDEELRSCLPPAFVRKLHPPLSMRALCRMIQALPGDRVRVPSKPDSAHKLASVLAMEEFTALCAHAKGQRIEIPIGRSLKAGILHQQIRALAAQGQPIGAIAKRTNRTARWVHKILNSAAGCP